MVFYNVNVASYSRIAWRLEGIHYPALPSENGTNRATVSDQTAPLEPLASHSLQTRHGVRIVYGWRTDFERTEYAWCTDGVRILYVLCTDGVRSHQQATHELPTSHLQATLKLLTGHRKAGLRLGERGGEVRGLGSQSPRRLQFSQIASGLICPTIWLSREVWHTIGC